MQELARVGARLRLTEIDTERREILSTFPELRLRTKRSARPKRSTTTMTNTTVRATNGSGRVRVVKQTAPVRTRRRMSPKARKAVSVRMTKYWAARRAEKSARV